MIQVNINTLTTTRSSIPQSLQGLSIDTLRNLQTELNPVPTKLKDIEFWDEVNETPSYDEATQTLDGTETLTCNAETKTVSVVRGIRAKTQEELNEMLAVKAKEVEQAVQSHINAKCISLGYDNENSIAKYLVEGNPFYEECKSLSLWIGNVWVKTFSIINEVRPIPTIEEILAELPEL